MKVYLDFETRSRLDLREIGASKYSQYLDCVLVCCYSINGGDVKTWIGSQPTDLFDTDKRLQPADLCEAVEAGAEMHAHNAAFEALIWANYCVPILRWPVVKPEQWYCTAAKAAALALPRSLREAGRALALATVKDDDGKLVMLQMCKPRKPSKDNPSIWFDDAERHQKLQDYCRDDVLAEIAIDEAIPDLCDFERRIYLADQRVNNRGIPVDVDLAEAAVKLWGEHCDSLNAQLCEATAGEVNKTTNVASLLRWIQSKGVPATSLSKAAIEKLLTEPLPKVCRTALLARQEAAKTSVAKFQKLLNWVEPDGRIRHVHLYHGATTGRWAGRGPQFQNVPQGVLDADATRWAIDAVLRGDRDELQLVYSSVGDVLASLIRPAICAEPGKRLITCDFAQIETRGLAWLANEEPLLDAFRKGEDIYAKMAAQIYGDAYDPKEKQQRQLGKAAVLGCGYGMGSATFERTCKTWGMEVDSKLAHRAVQTYRSTFPRITKIRHNVEQWAMRAIRSPGVEIYNGAIRWVVKGDWLYCILPSSRRLAYHKPTIARKSDDDFNADETIFFTGINQSGRAEQQYTYGGKLLENVVSGICRDILAEALIRLESAGYPPIMHVHDEIVVETASGTAEEMQAIMTQTPAWALGFPIDGEATESERYAK